MNKAKILLSLGAIIAIIALFYLPRVIISEDKQLAVQNETSHSDTSQAHAHDIEVPIALKNRIDILRGSYINTNDSEKRYIFADSLGYLFNSATLFDSALVYYKIAYQLKKGIKETVLLADVYYNLFGVQEDNSQARKMADEARALYEKVLEKQPDNLDVQAKMAMTYIGTDTPMQGIMMLRKVIEKDPVNKLALFNLGVLSVQSGQYDKAVERFLNLNKIAPDDYRAHYYLGLCYAELGKADLAQKYVDMVIKESADPALIEAAKQIQTKK